MPLAYLRLQYEFLQCHHKTRLGSCCDDTVKALQGERVYVCLLVIKTLCC